MIRLLNEKYLSIVYDILLTFVTLWLGTYINDFSNGFTLQLRVTRKHESEEALEVKNQESSSNVSAKSKWEYQYELEGEWEIGSKILMYDPKNK